MAKVYICGKIQENGIQLLLQKGYVVEINESGKDLTSDELKEIFSKYDAIITMITNKIDSSILKSASNNLKVIANYAVGFDNIDVAKTNKRSIVVANTPGVASESIAEHVFALILALNKMLKSADKYVRDGKYKIWNPNLFLSHQVWGQTIGIIGLGRIGTFVGQIASGGFRMKILYFDLKRAEDFELLTDAKYSSVEEILRDADIVTLHVPLTDNTRHLISTNQLRLMKNSAILINTSRGPVIDEKALVDALKNGDIAACGLDVFEHEPAVSPELTAMENVLLTPHTASATIETREKMSKLAAQNIIDVFKGRDPEGLVKI